MWVRFLMLGSKISTSSWWKSWKVRCLYWGTISKLSTFFISTWHYKESKYLNRTRYIGRTELKYLLVKLNERQFKSVALSLIESYSEQFIMKSRSIPTISDLFDPSKFDLSHPELQEKCEKYWSDNFRITGRINWARYQGTGERKCIFKHRAGHIGASLSWAVAHTNPAMPSQSLIKSISYPDLFKVTTEAISHGHKNESTALKRVSFSFKVL